MISIYKTKLYSVDLQRTEESASAYLDNYFSSSVHTHTFTCFHKRINSNFSLAWKIQVTGLQRPVTPRRTLLSRERPALLPCRLSSELGGSASLAFMH